jgi:hypothetical protein
MQWYFFLHHGILNSPGIQSIYSSTGIRDYALKVKWPEHEADLTYPIHVKEQGKLWTVKLITSIQY